MNSKKLRIIVDIAFIIAGIVFLIFGIRDFKSMIDSNKVSDAEKFSKSYSYVSSNNNYKYISIKDLEKDLKSGKHIIMFGDPTDSWTQILVEPLNSIIKEFDDKSDIEYIEIKDNMKSINEVLKSKNILFSSTPDILILSNGDVIAYYEKKDIYDLDYDGIPVEYWSDFKKEDLKKDLLNNLNKIIK